MSDSDDDAPLVLRLSDTKEKLINEKIKIVSKKIKKGK